MAVHESFMHLMAWKLFATQRVSPFCSYFIRQYKRLEILLHCRQLILVCMRGTVDEQERDRQKHNAREKRSNVSAEDKHILDVEALYIDF